MSLITLTITVSEAITQFSRSLKVVEQSMALESENVGSNPLSIVSLHWQVACLWTFVLKSIKMDIVPLTYRVIVQFQGDAIS